MSKGTLVLALSGHSSIIFDTIAALPPKDSNSESNGDVNGPAMSKKPVGPNGRTITAIITGADNGGHTGFLRKLAKVLVDNESFCGMYSYTDSVTGEKKSLEFSEIEIAIGDLKTQTTRWSKEHGDKMGNRIKNLDDNTEYVVSMFEQIILDPANKVADMCRMDGTTDDMIIRVFLDSLDIECSPDGVKLFQQELIRRFKLYLNCFLESSKAVPGSRDINHSIGNIILHFLYVECIYAFKKFDGEKLELSELSERLKAQDVFFGFLRNLNLVPSNLHLRMLKERGLHLVSETESQKVRRRIVGEGNIDVFKEGIFESESMKLYMDEKCTIECSEDEEIREIVRSSLAQSGTLVIPAGSVANWMPFVNQFGDLIRESGLPVFMIANAFIHISEPSLLDQINNIVDKLGHVVVIAPDENPTAVPGYKRHYKAGYETDEWKAPVDFDEVEANLPANARMLRVLEYKLYREKEGGLKYHETDISLILTFLNELFVNGEKPDIIKILERHGLPPVQAQIDYLENFYNELMLFKPENEIKVR
jgi:hypothetical protein